MLLLLCFCVLYFVFFFKQKTAYEMRISDWSSDVCSSDLDMLFYGVLGVIIGGRLGEVLFYDPAFYFSQPLEIFKVWKGGMSFHGGFLGEIGRASCRERVCQYV